MITFNNMQEIERNGMNNTNPIPVPELLSFFYH